MVRSNVPAFIKRLVSPARGECPARGKGREKEGGERRWWASIHPQWEKKIGSCGMTMKLSRLQKSKRGDHITLLRGGIKFRTSWVGDITRGRNEHDLKGTPKGGDVGGGAI